MLKALRKEKTGSLTIFRTKKALNELKTSKQTLSLNWIKAHIGLDGNELADSYAKQGARSKTNTLATPTTRAVIKKEIEQKSNEYWTSKWEKYAHCRQTKNFYPTQSNALHKKVSKLSRSALSTLIKIVTGQNNLNYLTHKIFPTHTDQCRFCEEEDETFIHLINECPVFYSLRLSLLNGDPIVGTVDWEPKKLVRFAQNSSIEDALNSVSNE